MVINEVRDALEDFLAANGYELYHLTWSKEAREWYLRIFIDCEAGIGTDDCEKVSRFISERLDELDLIDGAYFLEVSSPGMDRALVTAAHYEKYLGREIELRLYKPLLGKKHLRAILIDRDNSTLTIRPIEDNGNAADEMSLATAAVSKARLAI